MAKRQPGSESFVTQLLNFVVYLIALNALLAVIFVVGMHQLGNVTKDDLIQMVQVLTGERAYTMTTAERAEFDELKKAEERREALAKEIKGDEQIQRLTAQGVRDMEDKVKKDREIYETMVSRQNKVLENLRATIEARKTELKREEEKLTRAKQQRTADAISAERKSLVNTLQSTEAEALAEVFTRWLRNRGDGLEEVSRYMRNYIEPAKRAEIFAAMTTEDVGKILPRLENIYADRPPAEVKKLWTTPGTEHTKNFPQMAEYLRNMSTVQAFSIFRLFSPEDRAKLVPLLLSSDQNETQNP